MAVAHRGFFEMCFVSGVRVCCCCFLWDQPKSRRVLWHFGPKVCDDLKKQIKLVAGGGHLSYTRRLVSSNVIEMLQIHTFHIQVASCFFLLGWRRKCQIPLLLSFLHNCLVEFAFLAYHVQKRSLPLAFAHIYLVD